MFQFQKINDRNDLVIFFNPTIHRVTSFDNYNIMYLERRDFYEKKYSKLLCNYYVGIIFNL